MGCSAHDQGRAAQEGLARCAVNQTPLHVGERGVWRGGRRGRREWGAQTATE